MRIERYIQQQKRLRANCCRSVLRVAVPESEVDKPAKARRYVTWIARTQGEAGQIVTCVEAWEVRPDGGAQMQPLSDITWLSKLRVKRVTPAQVAREHEAQLGVARAALPTAERMAQRYGTLMVLGEADVLASADVQIAAVRGIPLA